MRYWIAATSLALATITSGCAERVWIKSQPTGAMVYAEGKPIGPTPVRVGSPRGRVRNGLPIRLELDGYVPVEATLSTRVAPTRVVGYVMTSGMLGLFKGVVSYAHPPVFVLETEADARQRTDAAPPTDDAADVSVRLRRIDQMRAAGTISEAEYRDLRAEVLRRDVLR